MSAELAVDEELLRPLLQLVPVHDVAFGRALNRLDFPRAMFDEPLPPADRNTLEMCMAQCEMLTHNSERVSTRLGDTEASTFSHPFERRHSAAPIAYSRRGG